MSIDGGASWRPAKLERDYGKYAWRQWQFPFRPAERGKLVVMVRATSKRGESQKTTLIWNPAGYHNNVPQQINLQIV